MLIVYLTSIAIVLGRGLGCSTNKHSIHCGPPRGDHSSSSSPPPSSSLIPLILLNTISPQSLDVHSYNDTHFELESCLKEANHASTLLNFSTISTTILLIIISL